MLFCSNYAKNYASTIHQHLGGGYVCTPRTPPAYGPAVGVLLLDFLALLVRLFCMLHSKNLILAVIFVPKRFYIIRLLGRLYQGFFLYLISLDILCSQNHEKLLFLKKLLKYCPKPQKVATKTSKVATLIL